MIGLTGIFRESTFSPAHHGQNDRLILELTAQTLVSKGCQIRFISEEEVGSRPIESPVIFSMCQGPRANLLLEQTETQGRLIINSPRAVQGCYRKNLFRLLGQNGHPLAPMILVSTNRTFREDSLPLSFEAGEAYWVKRGDVHSTGEGDVVKVNSPEECLMILDALHRKGVDEAVLQKHIEGTVVKFYGVLGTSFFRFYEEKSHNVSPVIFLKARGAIETVVKKIGLFIYGGDAVISEEGRISVIDINDWPSFAYFRNEAAEVIGQTIYDNATAFLAEHASAIHVSEMRLSPR